MASASYYTLKKPLSLQQSTIKLPQPKDLLFFYSRSTSFDLYVLNYSILSKNCIEFSIDSLYFNQVYYIMTPEKDSKTLPLFGIVEKGL
jgi:hypothetical protein